MAFEQLLQAAAQAGAVELKLVPGRRIIVKTAAGEREVKGAEQTVTTIRQALRYVAPEKLFPCTNCGMVPLSREVARGKLRALAAGAALVRGEL